MRQIYIDQRYIYIDAGHDKPEQIVVDHIGRELKFKLFVRARLC